MNETTVEQVPREAMRFATGPVRMAAHEDGSSIPLSMLARSADPIDHWYWGAVVHDMDGLELHKDRIAVDYCHADDEILGYIDGFDADPSVGLTLTGGLVPYRDDDRVSEIRHKAAQGVPYEASIYFDDAKVERLDDGQVATVNGREIEGPASIIRRWSLRGVAVCPYGADKNTNSQFTRDDETVAVSIQSGKTKGQKMSKPESNGDQVAENVVDAVDAPATEPADVPQDATELSATPEPAPLPAPVPAPVPADAGELTDAADPRAEAGKFRDVLGDRGAVLFAEGKNFDDAVQAVVGELRDQVADLESKLAAVDLGDELPTKLSTEGNEVDEKVDAEARRLGSSALANMAASFRNN